MLPRLSQAVLTKRFVSDNHPGYDYQDRLKSLIEKIAKHSPQGKIKAIQYVDKLASKSLPGMRELYDELSSN